MTVGILSLICPNYCLLPDKGDEPIANTVYILFVAAEFLLQNHFLVMYALNYDWYVEQHDYE